MIATMLVSEPATSNMHKRFYQILEQLNIFACSRRLNFSIFPYEGLEQDMVASAVTEN